MSCKILIISLLVLLASCNEKKENENITKVLPGDLYARGTEKNTYATEAVMQFNYKIWVKKNQFEDVTSFENMEPIFLLKVNSQIQHLFGSLSSSHYKGVPKLGPTQKILFKRQTMQFIKNRNEYVIDYSYEGSALVDLKMGSKVLVPLPRNPDLIYSQSKQKLEVNPCTDEHYNSEGDFWYFWNTDCKTISAGKQYDNVEVKLARIKNSNSTYPEYDRLIRTDKNGNKRLVIYEIHGFVEEMNKVPDNLEGIDETSQIFQDVTSNLFAKGFVQKSFKRLADSAILYTYEKMIPQSNLVMEVNLFFGNTGVEETEVNEFYKIYKEALSSGSVIMYGGHSGLGGNLDTETIEDAVGKISYDVNHYQIFLFDSCSSFPYYTQMYFNKKIGFSQDNVVDKLGTKNLDIITNGLSAFFVRESATSSLVINILNSAYETGVLLSWQQAIDKIHSTQMSIEPDLPGHLISVSGDEDNPIIAPKMSFEINQTVMKNDSITPVK